jgi:uroporphyrinogen decarboxylase
MNLAEISRKKFSKGERIAAPLLGFPAVKAAGTTIKLAQQNADEHMKVIRRIHKLWAPDVIFSLMDLSVEANALGRETVFPPFEAATVMNFDYERDRDLPMFRGINVLDDGRLRSYVETQWRMKEELPEKVLRGAYVTGPYTLAGLIVGAENAAMQTATEAEDLHALISVCRDKIMDYTQALIEAGAQLIALLDPSAMMLGPDMFREFAVAYAKPVVDLCHRHEVAFILHVCGDTEHLLKEMNASGADALSLDADVDFPKAAEVLDEDRVLIGNLCPTGTIMSDPPEAVEKELSTLKNAMRHVPNYIVSTGCDLPLEVPEENVTAFMKAARHHTKDH